MQTDLNTDELRVRRLARLYEDRVRRLARKRGFILRKSRAPVLHANNHGEYMLVDTANNCVALGGQYDASLEDVVAFLP